MDKQYSKLKYREIEPSTPQKPDKRLGLIRFVPKWIMEKVMRSNLAKLRSRSSNYHDEFIEKTDYNIAAYNGEITVSIYMPKNTEICPLTVYLHGGAFIGIRADGIDNYCRGYAARMHEAVLTVDYHLAPEYPYPHGLEDCYLACKWVCENAQKLNLNTDKLTLSGDSAGGNFAAVITLLNHQRRDFKIGKLILLYPYVSFAKPKLPITKVMHKWYLSGACRSDSNISPLQADLSKFPPTLTIVCEYDLLSESGKAFAEKLSRQGVDSSLVLFKRTRHAFLDCFGTHKQTGELLDILETWKKQIENFV